MIRPLRTVAALLPALAPFFTLPAVATAGGGSVPAQNRYVVMHMGDEVVLPGPPTVFRIDERTKRVSYRITALESGTVGKVWLYGSVQGAPGPFQIGLGFDDGSGLPLPPSATATLSPSAGDRAWIEVALAPAVRVQAGDVLHVTIEPILGAGTVVGSQNYVDLIPARSRFPVPFVAAPGSGKAARTPSSPRDPKATVLFDGGDGLGFVELRHAFTTFMPVFLLETDDGRLLGQPYDSHIEFKVGGGTLLGQEVTFDQDTAVDYVAMFVRRETQVDPVGHLVLRVYELDPQGAGTLLAQSNLALKQNPLYYLRSHWFGTYLDPGVTLRAGRTYVLALAMAGAGPGYVFSAEHCTLPQATGISPSAVPSYLGERSRAMVSLNGGNTFQSVRAPSDAAFILGRFGPSNRTPIGQLDEIAASTVDDADPATPRLTYPYVACPGEVIGLSVVARNIGRGTPPFASHVLFAVARDVTTGAILAQADYDHVPSNQEAPRCLEVTMPDVPLWRLSIEVGHYEPGGVLVTDDSVPLDIRRAPLPCPTNLDFQRCGQF